MSKAAKKRRSEARRESKARRKAVNRARYEAYVGTEENRKRKKKSNPARERVHEPGFCGNGACTRCYNTAANNPWKASPNSCIYSKRWTSSQSVR